MRVEALGLRVQGSGLSGGLGRVKLGFRGTVWVVGLGLGLRVEGLGLGVQGSGFRVWPGFR